MAETMANFSEITLRSFVSLTMLFFVTKMIGPRQIAQLTFYDYVTGITVGSIAAAIAIDRDLSLWLGLWAIIIYIAISYLMAWSGNKSLRARHFFSGTPKFLVCKGKIIEKNLSSQNLDLGDLLAACRMKGYFNLADLEHIILENNGNLSFLPKSNRAPVTVGDIAMCPPSTMAFANVIMDGNIMNKHLKAINKDENWLREQLRIRGETDISKVFLAIANEEGDFYYFRGNDATDDVNLFD